LYIQKHPESKKIEIEKLEKGKYLRPELYNKPKSSGIFYIKHNLDNNVETQKLKN